ncbi:sensor histidine kinase [Chitinophaga rhizosphaerae]|uniref:sensor histidine kinase n=1 Tax=Chitinophaga rhizosphaerae TaxID=1864947 RepID=UPI000F80174F|nr:HAMP domain-containing sensor histidine kinase [Chitinophaga rhizosphaerae]
MHYRRFRALWLCGVLTVLCSARSFGQLRHIRQLQQSLLTIQDSLAYTDALAELADYYHYRQWDSVLYYTNQAMGIAERHGYERGIAAALTGKGVYFMTRNNYLSSRYNNDALRLYRKMGDSVRVSLLLNNIAINFIFDGNYAKCVAKLYEAERVARSAPKDSIRSIALLNLIDIDTTLTKRQRDSMLVLARRCAEKWKDEVMLNYCHQLEAKRLINAGGGNEGLQDFLALLADADNKGNLNFVSFLHHDIGKMILEAGGDSTLAMQHFTEGFEIAQRQKFSYVASLLLPELMSLAEARGDTALALHYAQMALAQNAEAATELQSSGFTYFDYVLNERNLRESQAHQAAQKRTIYLLILLTIVTGGLLFFLYRSQSQTRKMARIQQELREKTEERNRELEDWDQFHSMLISVMAHDLRAPFSSIITISQLFEMAHDLTPQEIEGMMASLKKTSEDSIRFMEGLLSWISAKRKGGKFQSESFKLEDVMRDANRFYSLAQEEKKVHLVLDESLEGQEVFAEKNMLGFICRNILNNATKYAAKGKPIVVRAYAEGDSLVTAITNYGKELSEAEIHKIFHPDQKSMATKDGLKGAGIAMIISQDMLERMHGRIWAESEPGIGTTFYFALPRNISTGKTVAV